MKTNNNNLCNSNTPEFQILTAYDSMIEDLEKQIKNLKHKKDIIFYNMYKNCNWDELNKTDEI